MRLRRGEGRAVLGVVRSALRLRRFLAAELARAGLTPVQVELLLAIRAERCASQAHLGRRLQVTRQAIDGALDDLARQELVEKVADETLDRRSCLWSLTEGGDGRLDAALDALVDFEERSLPGMTEEQRTALAGLLDRAAEELAREERMKWFPLRAAMW